jgi:hypothetical protein
VPTSSAPGIFLSYRREDTTPYTLSLRALLQERFPNARIFMDLDSIEAGLDFVEVIEDAVNSCTVLVALIGRQWATITDKRGADGWTTPTTTYASRSKRHSSARCGSFRC